MTMGHPKAEEKREDRDRLSERARFYNVFAKRKTLRQAR